MPVIKSEAAVSAEITMELSRRGSRVFRNNSGAVTTDDGRHVRFGLGNISAKINKSVKSSDLIGITPVIITQDMVGKQLGVMLSIEVKNSTWKRDTNDPHQNAQQKWIDIIKSLGGIGGFVSDIDQLDELLKIR